MSMNRCAKADGVSILYVCYGCICWAVWPMCASRARARTRAQFSIKSVGAQRTATCFPSSHKYVLTPRSIFRRAVFVCMHGACSTYDRFYWLSSGRLVGRSDDWRTTTAFGILFHGLFFRITGCLVLAVVVFQIDGMQFWICWPLSVCVCVCVSACATQ